jgi:hypothetical protein
MASTSMLLQVLELSYCVFDNYFLMLLQDGSAHTAGKTVPVTSVVAFLPALLVRNAS